MKYKCSKCNFETEFSTPLIQHLVKEGFIILRGNINE